MKKCIVYIPYKLDLGYISPRIFRPLKMIQAFRDIGYDPFVIEGVSSVRRKRIRDLKASMENGAKYDFLYTESNTMPTLLADPHHMPTHPFLDFGFFRYVKKRGIPIGLFYPDIYWKFDTYGTELPAWKRTGALLCYRYDISQYKKYLDKFYLPDLKVCAYLKEDALEKIADELLPGAENLSVQDRSYQGRDFHADPLTIFYVGGLSNQYQIVELAKAVRRTENCKLILCCRKPEWDRERGNFEGVLCDRISVVHRKSDQLEEFYRQADICSLLFKKDAYREMAKPFKAFEYLAHEIPVLSTKGTAIGEFVEENGIGWNIPYTAEAISDTLRDILENPAVLEEKRLNCKKAKANNLWTTRAEKVAADFRGWQSPFSANR